MHNPRWPYCRLRCFYHYLEYSSFNLLHALCVHWLDESFELIWFFGQVGQIFTQQISYDLRKSGLGRTLLIAGGNQKYNAPIALFILHNKTVLVGTLATECMCINIHGIRLVNNPVQHQMGQKSIFSLCWFASVKPMKQLYILCRHAFP